MCLLIYYEYMKRNVVYFLFIIFKLFVIILIGGGKDEFCWKCYLIIVVINLYLFIFDYYKFKIFSKSKLDIVMKVFV